jgi:hypothetical protein
MEIISLFPFRFAKITGTSPQNSQISCRQAPHGGVNVSVSVTTAIALNFRSPSLIALKIATRSAHTVNPYVAFSTLHPPNIFPPTVRSAAPTWNPEYFACAFWRDFFATSIKALYSATNSSTHLYPPIIFRTNGRAAGALSPISKLPAISALASANFASAL